MKKKILILVILILLLFPINIFAETATAYYKKVMDTDGYGSGKYGNKNAVYFLTKDIYSPTMSFATFHIYYVNDSNTYYQSYCVEPGTVARNNTTFTLIPYGDYDDEVRIEKSYLKMTSTQIALLKKAMTYSGAMQSASKSSMDTAISNMEYPWPSSDYLYKKILARSIATQGLVWEIVTGERTSFGSYVGDRVNSIHGKTNSSFCSAFINGAACGVNYTSPADNTYVSQEYKRLVDMASVDGVYPSRFDATNGTNGTKLVLNYDATTKKYIGQVKVTNKSFKRCVATSSNDGTICSIETEENSGVTVSVDSNNLLTIRSSKYIDESNPVTITYKKRQSTGTTINWYDDTDATAQTLVRSEGGALVSKMLNVYTQEFGLKVLKIDSITKEPIKDVDFNLYSNSACTGTPIASETTGVSGIAEFTGLTSSTKVYVKEDASTSPTGYKINNSCIGIVPSSDVENLTPLEVEEQPTQLIINKKDERLELITASNAKFTLKKKSNNTLVYFTGSNGLYKYSSTSEGAIAELVTKNGAFSISYLPIGDYILTETESPEGYTLPEDVTTDVSVNNTDKTVIILNGIVGGLVFEKVDENGTYLSGGLFSLQKKINNVYQDVLLEEESTGVYKYSAVETEETAATFSTSQGIGVILNLPTGLYRIVEKQAPEGYDLLDQDDGPSFSIIEAGENNIVRMIDTMSTSTGSDDNATLIITISTGRNVRNYFLIISCIILGLGATLFIKRKLK